MVFQLEVRLMLLLLVLLLGLTGGASSASSLAKTGCNDTCGSVKIPFPFGIGADCAANDNFTIICDSSSSKPYFNSNYIEVLYISLELATVRVLYSSPTTVLSNISVVRLPNPFSWLYFDPWSFPAELRWDTYGNCQSFSNVPANNNNTSNIYWPLCKASDSFCSNLSFYNSTTYNLTVYNPAAYNSTAYRCFCSFGYEGNPYLDGGCQDIDECALPNPCPNCKNLPGYYTCGTAMDKKKTRIIIIGISTGVVGILLLLIGTWWLYRLVKKRKELRLKQKFFKRNGGLLLQQQLSLGDEGNVEKNKLFTSKELEKATDHFNDNRILGQGGQGTVYKGMMIDGRIVAVKKSKIVDEGKLDQFINEVVILSQINHRNVVKLHGCCLEAEVPLLVYEFIPNGTLYQYIHEQNEEFPLTWDIRVRVATEVSGALSYLHSAASMPIYHRDIKSTNILLDEKFRAKVSDFGTSKSVAIDQTHMTTLVQGTFGYLDPEYFQSSQFTEKVMFIALE